MLQIPLIQLLSEQKYLVPAIMKSIGVMRDSVTGVESAAMQCAYNEGRDL